VRSLLLLIGVYIFISVAASATQYPHGDNYSYLSQPASSYSAPSVGTSTVIETYLTPYDGAEDRLLKFLDQAQARCYVASYSLTNRNIINKLIQLHFRGVDVQIITDRTQAAGRSEQAALAALTANGIPVFAGKSIDNALMHCKFCLIDDRYVEDGSWNFTTSANREDNILNFCDSPQRAAQFLAYWQRIKVDLQRSRFD
jgi:phosphatidylserine/phosphatidylglycerophosphate/cardiolipin synthase-like enzyme